METSLVQSLTTQAKSPSPARNLAALVAHAGRGIVSSDCQNPAPARFTKADADARSGCWPRLGRSGCWPRLGCSQAAGKGRPHHSCPCARQPRWPCLPARGFPRGSLVAGGRLASWQALTAHARRRLRLPLPISTAPCEDNPRMRLATMSLLAGALAGWPGGPNLSKGLGLGESRALRRKKAREGQKNERHRLPGPGRALAVDAADRRRLDLVVHGSAASGVALCCDAMLVSPAPRAALPLRSRLRGRRTLGPGRRQARRRPCSSGQRGSDDGGVSLRSPTSRRWRGCSPFRSWGLAPRRGRRSSTCSSWRALAGPAATR